MVIYSQIKVACFPKIINFARIEDWLLINYYSIRNLLGNLLINLPRTEENILNEPNAKVKMRLTAWSFGDQFRRP